MTRSTYGSAQSYESLTIRLLGCVEIGYLGRSVSDFPTRKSRLIFAFLAINRRKGHARDYLARSFWPDRGEQRGRAALRTELWRIRSTIARAGADPHDILAESPETLRFSPRMPYRLDIEELDGAIGQCPSRTATADEIGAVECAVHLYGGDLLEDDDGEWCVATREYYRSRFLCALDLLIEHAMMLGDWRRAVEWCERLLVYDPLAEHVHRCLMTCHNELGNRPAAIRQFARCQALLRSELSVEPMDMTLQLHERIMRGATGAGKASPASNGSDSVLRLARDSLAEAARRLDAAIDKNDLAGR